MPEYEKMSASELAAALRARRIGAEELTAFYLDRIAKFDGRGGLNAVAEINPDALRQARALDAQRPSPEQTLYGLPILLKDNIDAAGLATTAGSLALTDNIAKKNAPITENILARGGILLGKTNMTEFANFLTSGMPAGFSSRGGQVKSAYGACTDPGGSSTGSAVAVSAGLCAMAVGTDTNFSVVGCAACNGVVGFKPAAGALPSGGVLPISGTLDSPGTLTHTLEDALLLYGAMAGRDLPPLSPTPVNALKLAVNTFERTEVSAAQLARYDAVFEALRTEGASFSEVDQPYAESMGDIMVCEFRRDLERYLANASAKRKTVSDLLAFYRDAGEAATPYGVAILEDAERMGTEDADYQKAMAERARAQQIVRTELAPFDACVMTGASNIIHFTGLPSVAIKLGMAADGTPRGMILYGVDEMRLLRAALTVEQHCQAVVPPEL